ncbi:protein of unknown function DUF461 [Rhodothermus marinus SG0.5JP17-172]|uniref:copper chaperone PCu(A)C n=1 Tax=Rhodothermus marinus TaxID=29549 RepID=UPI000223DCDA|nr:copper chaperone PCu(A)C [Rhodothermus marinus]AEN73700.1 protein of unknown function DUF461 [Rhodothermus marinus SG0.5JP17-172]MBO2492057.1 copper chaperone PCu(A)C [Rhodothermus marinus]
MRYLATVFLGLFLLIGCGQQQREQPAAPAEPPLPEGRLAVEEPVVYAAAAGDSAIVSLRIANGTAEADTLVGAEAPAVTRNVALREVVGDTVQTTRPATSIVIPPRSRVAVQLVLRNLQQAIEPGQTVLVDLRLARQGRLRVRVPVREAAAPTE